MLDLLLYIYANENLKELPLLIVTTDGFFEGRIIGIECNILELDLGNAITAFIFIDKIVGLQIIKEYDDCGIEHDLILEKFVKGLQFELTKDEFCYLCCNTGIPNVFNNLKRFSFPTNELFGKIQIRKLLTATVSDIVKGFNELTLFYGTACIENVFIEDFVAVVNIYVDSIVEAIEVTDVEVANKDVNIRPYFIK